MKCTVKARVVSVDCELGSVCLTWHGIVGRGLVHGECELRLDGETLYQFLDCARDEFDMLVSWPEGSAFEAVLGGDK